MFTNTYTTCEKCGYATAGKFCSECGEPHNQNSKSHSTKWNPDYDSTNRYYSETANPYNAQEPRPGDPTFDEYWSRRPMIEDDFGASLAAGIILAAAAVGVITIIGALTNSNKKLTEGD